MRLLLIALLALLVGARCIMPLQAQEATETPAPEATAEVVATPTPLPYAWCGYLLLEGVVVDEDALTMLGRLFPPAEDDAPAQALMQWRGKPDGNGGILEGCHVLPVERWRIVSLLQQGTGMEYAQMDESLVLTEFADAAGLLAFLDEHAAEWEEADEVTPEATPDL